MSINLVDLITKEISGDVIGKIGSFLGEDNSKITKGVGGAVPALLGGLLSKGSSQSGASQILDLIKGGNYGESTLSNIGSMLSGGDQTNNLLKSSTSLLGSLFGDKVGSIVDTIASLSGIGKNSASSLLGMVVPFVMGTLGKQVSSNGLNASGLMNLLGSQKGFLEKLLPAGLTSVLGLSSILNIGQSAKSAVTDTAKMAGDAAKSGFSFLKWLLPLALALVVLYFLFKSCNTNPISEVSNVVDNAKTTVVEKVDDAASTVAETAQDAASKVNEAWASLGAFGEFVLPNDVKLNIPELGVERKLISFIEDNTKMADKTTWFTFDRLEFETGSSILKPSSQEQLKNIAEIMKAFPAVELKIGGYTDNTGNPKANVELSQKRAENTLAELVKLGVSQTRLNAEGYGDQHPIADNNTEEGRAKNRRIDLRVAKK